MEKMKEMRKRQNASKGYKEWLKMSLVKAKQEHYVKKQMRKMEKKQKKEQQKFEERKRVEAEIQFKQWKLKKTRQERQERRVKKLMSKRWVLLWFRKLIWFILNFLNINYSINHMSWIYFWQ